MKKIIFVLLIISLFFLTACKECEDNRDCRITEICVNEKCEDTDCSDKCPDTGNPCSTNICSSQTRNMCKEIANYGEQTGCEGPVPDKECKEYYCDNMACLEKDDYDCIEANKPPEPTKYCSDGTEDGLCSKVNKGMFCDGEKLIDDFKEDCLEELEEQKKEAPKLTPDPCGEVAHGACSPDQEGYICNDGELELDETCLPEPEPAPLVEEGCGDTLEGDCSPDGKWCVHDQLIPDDACANQCEDGTPNWGCSFNTPGYLCEDSVLVEDGTCDPNYVWELVDCEDGTVDGYCNAAGTQWCDHGVLVDLQEGESC